jgi:CPA1 family monovalent cation:H+ antiporter
MLAFEWTLLLLMGAVGLTLLARALRLPYPVLVALGGTALALFPNIPRFDLNPSLTLALFVAPVLLDSAFDFSLRDLRRNWIPVTLLVVVAVAITTAAVAIVVHCLVPDMPWPAAVALGAIVAPPDAAAAVAVLRQMNLPHRLMVVLEGESLLNDASALLIYRVAVSAVVADGISATRLTQALALGVLGSIMIGYLAARLYGELLMRVQDVPSATVLQFTGTFGVWIGADRLGLSPVVTVVVFAFTAAQLAPRRTAARIRVPSYAVWETIVFVLNIMAFMLIGLQLRPIVLSLNPVQRVHYAQVAGAVLATIVAARIAWVLLYNVAAALKSRIAGPGQWPGEVAPSWAGGLVVAWSGMRGVVTLAAAYALPVATEHSAAFPYRDLILLCAFCTVVGTLVIHGLTLRPLMRLFALRGDDTVQREVLMAQQEINKAALAVIDGDESPEALVLRRELTLVLEDSRLDAQSAGDAPPNLRAMVVTRQRKALLALRASGVIGDDAFHQIEAQLDIAELSVNGPAPVIQG